MAQQPQDSVGALFELVDRDGNGAIDFEEAVSLFQALAPTLPPASAQNAALEALLESDSNLDKRLSRREFEQLLHTVAGVSGLTLDEAAQRLLAQASQQQQHVAGASPAAGPSHEGGSSAAASAALAAADATAAARDQPSPAAESADDKIARLFALWDQAGEGTVDFSELCQGLSKLRQPLKHKQDIMSVLSEAAGVLAVHDTDGDRRLSQQEFRDFMQRFMAAAGMDLAGVLPHLIELAQSKPNSRRLQETLDTSAPTIERLLSARQGSAHED